MRGQLMRLFTKEQHLKILVDNSDDTSAAAVYTATLGGSKVISRQVASYWRKVFLDNNGNLSGTDRELKENRVLIRPQPDDDIGDTSFLRNEANMVLVIPDIHAPYHHQDTLAFLNTVKNTFYPDLVVSLGDEVDYHALSFHDSDPNLESAGTELELAKVFLQDLHGLFPQMLVCHSNHGSMVYRRAKAHGIPVQCIKRYRDILFPEHKAPQWSWAYSWRIGTPLGEVLFKHQSSGVINDAAHNRCNLVVGHHHGTFGIEYSASSALLYYAMQCGCLVDKDSLAFAYGRHALRKPIVGCGLIMNGRPVLLPMILGDDGRWIGRL